MAALAMTTACGGPGADATLHRADVAYAPAALTSASALPEVLAANDALGLALLAAAEETGSSNAVVSPFSLYSALAMLGEGARGGTAEAFDVALGAPAPARVEAFSALRADLAAYDGDPAAAAGEELPERPLLHLASRAVLDDQLVPEPTYLDALARWFDAGVETVDLASPAAKRTLDEWVKRETGGLIERSAITPNEDLRLVLQDAIVLAAAWESPFGGPTRPEDFTSAAGTAQVETMHAAGSWLVTERDGWTRVRLPYAERLVADLVLPPDGVAPAELPAEVLAWLRAGTDDGVLAAPGDGTEVAVSVPRLDLEPDVLDLAGALEEVGLGELFERSPYPDLSGITTAEPLVLDQAFQQARLRLDEDGTVAAAVTEIGAVAGSAVEPSRRIEVRLDRPFLVRVGDGVTGATLFLSAVNDPGRP